MCGLVDEWAVTGAAAIDVDGPAMCSDATFDAVMSRVRAGDGAAETALFEQYVRRLIALAARQFDGNLRNRADVELVVLSACKSFFLRNRRGEFQVDDWGELWSVLAMITLRKCAKRRRHLRAARRDAGREVAWPDGDVDPSSLLLDRDPTPVEAAILTDTVAMLFQAMTPDDRPIVEQILLGYTAQEVAAQLGCSERTVRRVRQRAQRRLDRLADPQETARPKSRTREENASPPRAAQVHRARRGGRD
jgi:DNA-directed RNA polymerase specialized sigma24 family protein